MRRIWIEVAAVAAVALANAGPLAAQQTQLAQQSRRAAPALRSDPNLNADDQLAPSQIKQPMPAAVAEPAGAAAPAPVHPIRRAAGEAPTERAKAAPALGSVIDCGKGVFSRDSSHLRLAMTFPSSNLTFGDVTASDGSKVQVSILYPNDPKRRLEVWWSNPAERRDTYLIDIHGQSMWTAPGGMKLGMTLVQLEKLNRKPFKLKGFDKTGVASVSDWDGGALSTLPGGCDSGISLRADPKASADAVSAMTGDKDFSSSDPALRATKPTVSEILIGFPKHSP